MAKRKRSYEENFEPQLKTHVNNKIMQLNNEEQMKIIYDKTRNMLFSGARNLSKKMGESNNNNSVKLTSASNVNIEEKLMDTRTINIQHENKWKCYFCDEIQLESNIVQCFKCDYMFCGKCSLVLYDNTGESYICLSCA